MSYIIPKHRVQFNASLTLSDGYLPTIVNDFHPFSHVERFPESGTADVWGMFTEVIFNGAQHARLKVSLVNEKSVLYGPLTMANGSFPPDTVFDALAKATAMAFPGPGMPSSDRATAGEPMETVITSYTLLSWKPQRLVDPFAFVLTFTPDVWLCLCITIIILAALSAFIDRFLTPWESVADGFASYLWEFYSRLYPQGPSPRQDTWIRIILLSFMLPISVLFMTILNSELTSTMLIMKTTPTVEGYEDILLFKNLKIFTQKDTGLHTMFSDPRSELFRRLRPLVVPVNSIFHRNSETYELLSAVEKRQGVIVLNEDAAHSLIMMAYNKWNRCPHLKVTRKGAGLLVASVFLSRRMPDQLRRKLRKGFRATTEGGIISHSLAWMRRESDICMNLKDDGLKALTVDQLEGSFVVLALGVACCMFSIVIEMASMINFRRFCRPTKFGFGPRLAQGNVFSLVAVYFKFRYGSP